MLLLWAVQASYLLRKQGMCLEVSFSLHFPRQTVASAVSHTAVSDAGWWWGNGCFTCGSQPISLLWGCGWLCSVDGIKGTLQCAAFH